MPVARESSFLGVGQELANGRPHDAAGVLELEMSPSKDSAPLEDATIARADSDIIEVWSAHTTNVAPHLCESGLHQSA